MGNYLALGVGNYVAPPLGNYLALEGLRLGNCLIADIFFARCGLGVRQMVAGYDTLFVPAYRRRGLSFI